MANEFVVRKGLIVSGSTRMTGSLEVSSYVSASEFSGSFHGDGSGLTGVTTDVASIATFAETFTSQTSFTATHNLSTASPIVQVYDDNDEQIIPQTIKIDNSQQVTITFPTATSGKVVIAKGGHLFSEDPALQYAEAFISQSVITVNHSLGTITPIVQVYNADNEQVIPQTIKALTSQSVQVVFPVSSSGTVTVAKGGHKIDAVNLSYTSQTFTNTSLVSVTHSFGTTAPIVQVYNDSGLQVIPEEIRIINGNSLEVQFPVTSSGTVAVSRGGHIITSPVFSGSFTGQITSTQNLLPSVDNAYSLGTADTRWSDVFTTDLHLSNEGSSGNSVDGTTGNWTVQEGNEYLYVINNKSGKKFKIVLEEVT